MRSTPLSLVSALVLGTALGSAPGCAETPPPALPTAAPPATVAAQVTPPTDLTPVAEPTEIFVSARWKNPNATLSGLSSCAGVPGALIETNARTLLDKALANAFRGGVDGRKIAELVALDAPVDLIVSLDAAKRIPPQVLFAFSIGLTSLERARAALSSAGEIVELAPGLYRVGAADSGDLSCALGPAAGSAPARLICGKYDKDVITLGPYLARNLPLAEPPARDVHAELRFTPVDQRYGADLRRGLGFLPNYARTQTIGDPRYDRALEEAATALADEGAALAGDLDRVTLDLGVDASSCLEARTSLQLRGKSSWLAGTIAESGNRAGPAPAIFWHAPVDSDSASYGRATDVSRYSGIFRTLRGLVEGKLAKEKVGSEADRKALAALIALPLGKDTNVVVASGHVHSAPRPPADVKLSEQQLADELINGYLGWYLLGFDEGPEALTRLLKEVVSVYGRKGLTDPVRKELGEDAGALPAAKLVPAPRELGKGALELELKFDIPSKRGEKKPISFALHLLLMPDGKSTWVAVGANRDALVKHLQMAKTGAPDTATLATRPGLEALRTGKALSSGFLTLAMFTRGISSVLGNPALAANSKRGPVLAEIANTLNNLPHRGETPIFVTSEAAPREGGARGELTLQVQKGSFEDIGVMLMTGLRVANAAGAARPYRPPTEQPPPTAFAVCYLPSRSEPETRTTMSEAMNGRRRAPAPPPASPSAPARSPLVPPVPPRRPAEPDDDGPEALTAEQIQELRGALEARRAQLIASIDERREQERDTGREVGDEMDEANTEGVSAMTSKLLERDVNLMREIDRALAKLSEGTYGLCEGTGEPIGYSRLKLRPWARYGVEYQEEIERAERSRGGV